MSLNRVGFGNVLGMMLVNLCWPKQFSLLPYVMLMWGEVVGLHTTLQWVLDLQFDNMDFTLYSKRVVDHVNSDVKENIEFACIIFACRQLLQNSYQS